MNYLDKIDYGALTLKELESIVSTNKSLAQQTGHKIAWGYTPDGIYCKISKDSAIVYYKQFTNGSFPALYARMNYFMMQFLQSKVPRRVIETKRKGASDAGMTLHEKAILAGGVSHKTLVAEGIRYTTHDQTLYFSIEDIETKWPNLMCRKEFMRELEIRGQRTKAVPARAVIQKPHEEYSQE